MLASSGDRILLNRGTNHRTVKTIAAICFNVGIDLIGCSVERIYYVRAVGNIRQSFFEC